MPRSEPRLSKAVLPLKLCPQLPHVIRVTVALASTQIAVKKAVLHEEAQGLLAGFRRSRYRGPARTHLQHVATAVAIDLARVANWLLGGMPRDCSTLSPCCSRDAMLTSLTKSKVGDPLVR